MRVNEEIDRRVPSVDEERAREEPGKRVAPEHMAPSRGATALLGAIVFLAFLAAVAAATWLVLMAPYPVGDGDGKPMDGSSAGANAVALEEIETGARRNGE